MIHDQFTHLLKTMSRQQVWQLRRKAAGKCVCCGKKAVATMSFCVKCHIKSRERRPAKNRHQNTKFFRLTGRKIK